MNFGFDLSATQARLRDIFGANNNKVPVWILQQFLVARATSFLATIEKKDRDLACTQLVQIFSWVAAVANHTQALVDLKEAVLFHFPGVCPYCGDSGCTCGIPPNKVRSKDRIPESHLAALRAALSEDTDLQLMFFNIFPRNRMRSSVDHLLAEIGEVGGALARAALIPLHLKKPVYLKRPTGVSFPELSIELTNYEMEMADVVAHIFAIANLLAINLLDEVDRYFRDGCPVCTGKICRCLLQEIELKKVGTQKLTDTDT